MKTTRHGECRLTLTINGTDYGVTPVSVHNEAKTYRLKKRGERIAYEVGVSTSGDRFCNCPDYVQRNPEGGCKHIKSLVALGII